jgi:predicted lipid-binding transport protein (Tim44 family)
MVGRLVGGMVGRRLVGGMVGRLVGGGGKQFDLASTLVTLRTGVGRVYTFLFFATAQGSRPHKSKICEPT